MTGWRKWAFAFDEFNHRHGLNTRGPLRWFCRWWDRYLTGDELPGVHWK